MGQALAVLCIHILSIVVFCCYDARKTESPHVNKKKLFKKKYSYCLLSISFLPHYTME